MNVDLAVAVIAGVVAVITAVWTGFMQQRVNRMNVVANREQEAERHVRTEQASREERQEKAAAVLDQYRKPLLAAAVELSRRIGNIRCNSFLEYLHSEDHRAAVAMQSTLYRFAAFLGWRELLVRELTYLPFERADQRRAVVQNIEDVSSQLASDGLDVREGVSRLMLWKDEQRAIGGLMLAASDVAGVIGFETFVTRYDEAFAVWLDSFSQDLRLPGIEHGERLERVAESLGELITILDAERLYTGRV